MYWWETVPAALACRLVLKGKDDKAGKSYGGYGLWVFFRTDDPSVG